MASHSYTRQLSRDNSMDDMLKRRTTILAGLLVGLLAAHCGPTPAWAQTAQATPAQDRPEPSTTAETAKPKPAEPFAFADFTWLTGNPRTKDSPLDTKVFTGEFRVDTNYTYSFNHPQDDTISGSSEVFRHNEVQVTQLGVGGDFHVDNVRGRLMTQFGMYSQTTPRNDASPGRGQWNLDSPYRYISEAYGGYHWDRMHGINVDGGIFMSYVGLWSYYQFDNWTYRQAEDRALDYQRLAVVRQAQPRAGRRRAGVVASERLSLDHGEQLLGHRHAGQSRPQAHSHRRQHPGEVLRQAGRDHLEGGVHLHVRCRM
jgi:hypothetical protein